MGETMNNTVEETMSQVSVQDDAVQEQATANALEEFMTEDEEQATESEAQETETAQEETASDEPTQQPQQAQTNDTVPKGIKGRIQAAESKADARGYSRGRDEAKAEYEQKIAEMEQRLSKYAEMEVTLEAQELSRKEHISMDLAKRLIRAEKGLGTSTVQEAQPAPKTALPKLSQDRLVFLKQQQDNIIKTFGIDPAKDLSEENARAIWEGKKDFNDLALGLLANRPQSAQPKQNTPTPVKANAERSENKAYDFMTMSDEEFDRFNKKIASGKTFKPR